MSENVTFSEAPGRSASPGQIVAKVGIASIGAANTVLTFEAGQVGQVDAIGYGDMPASTRRNLRHGEQRTVVALADIDTAGAISVITTTGGGPTITAAAIPASGDQIEGPWFTFPSLLFTVVRAGPLGEARAEFSYDGVTKHETVDILPALPATAIGTIDLTGITPSSVNTKTFIANPDGNGNKTCTFADVVVVDNIVSQINDSLKEAATLLGTADLTAYTAADINGKTLIFTDVNGEGALTILFAGVATLADIATQIAAGAGITAALITGDFIRITSDVLGDESHLLIGGGTANGDLGFAALDEDSGAEYGTASIVAGRYLKVTAETVCDTGTLVIGSGTGNTILGFTNAAEYEGTNSTYDIPNTGVRVTFPVGDYEENTTYELSTAAPQMGVPDFEAAAAALRASGEKFSILHVVHEPIDGIDLAAWQTALEAFRVELATSEDNPMFIKWILGGPMAPIEDWNDVDTDVKLSLAGSQADNKFNTIVHGDVFLEWEEYTGRHRAQLAHCYVEECAKYPLNVNPGFGGKGQLRNAYLKNFDGSKARTEADALIKLQDHGFSVLRDDQKTPFIRAGRTRAPSVSQFTGEHTARAALECGRVMREAAFFYSNSTPKLDKNGQLDAAQKVNVENRFNGDLQKLIVEKGYASSARATVLGMVSVGGSDKLLVKAVFQRLANVENVDITVFVTNSLEIVEGAQ